MIGSYPDTEQVDRNCPVCGAELIPGDTFCEQCGSPIDEAPSGPAERTLFETRPSAYRVVKSALCVGLISLIASGALGYLGGKFVHVLALTGAPFLIPLIREIQRRRIDIIVTTTRLGLETDVFACHRRRPLHSIRNVTTKSSMFQRVFVGDVLVDSATVQGEYL